VNREIPLFLSDLPVDRDGAIMLSKKGTDHALMGHYGNLMLVNGEEQYALSAKKGEVIRLDVINAANARPFNFTISGAQLKVVGGDNGAYEKAFYTDAIVLGPSERMIVDVLFAESGTYQMENKTPDYTYKLGTIVVASEAVPTSYAAEFNTLQSNKATSASIDAFRPYFDKAPDKRLALTVSLAGRNGGGHMMGNGSMMGGSMGSMMSGSSDGIEWEDAMPTMSNLTTDSVKWAIVDRDTQKVNQDIDWTLAKGVPVKIEIYNDPNSMHPMQHPIHFHGQRFLIVSRNGVPQTNLVWKDTALIKAGEKVEVVLDTSNPGMWMGHCHIAEHLQGSMMFMYTVK
jgi:FtsP/CotA-like multicopper oxidase with cupredoxin domain